MDHVSSAVLCDHVSRRVSVYSFYHVMKNKNLNLPILFRGVVISQIQIYRGHTDVKTV